MGKQENLKMGEQESPNERVAALENEVAQLRGMLILSRDVGLTVGRAVERRHYENPLTTHDQYCGIALPNGECTCGAQNG